MKKINLVLIYLISLTITLYGEQFTFKQLAKLASIDMKSNIYVDDSISNYTVDFNIADYQKQGEVATFFNIVLFNHDMKLVYNKDIGFYTIKKLSDKVKILPPKPIDSPIDRKHFYTYKIKHISNKDVADTLSIFDIKYKYLSQSDMIAYSCTTIEHENIKRLLRSVDKSTNQKTIKISIFTVNKSELSRIGNVINSFGISLNSSITKDLLSTVPTVSTSITSFDISSYLTALENFGITNIEHSPTVLLTNGVEAIVESVSNVRYLTAVAEVDNSNNNTVRQNYEYRDVGLKLKFLPKIKNDWIYLDMDFTSEEFLTFTLDNPTVGKIRYKNSFKIKKGKSLLLTGINKSVSKKVNSGIPLLKDLPIFGKLFGSEDISIDHQNINILIEVL